jgi:hypothetical protein
MHVRPRPCDRGCELLDLVLDRGGKDRPHSLQRRAVVLPQADRVKKGLLHVPLPHKGPVEGEWWRSLLERFSKPSAAARSLFDTTTNFAWLHPSPTPPRRARQDAILSRPPVSTVRLLFSSFLNSTSQPCCMHNTRYAPWAIMRGLYPLTSPLWNAVLSLRPCKCDLRLASARRLRTHKLSARL